MKRIFAYLSVAVALAACNLYGEPETSTTPLEAKDIDIAISAVGDSSFTVTLTPQGEAAFYSYLVDASDEIVPLDPSTLYSVGYTSVAQGTVCYAQNPSYSFTVAAAPNTPYVVYAVSSSVEGNVGSVVTAQTRTSDGVAPYFEDYSASGRVATFTFSEPVKAVEGKKISAKYYASNLYTKTYYPYLDDSQKMGVTDSVAVEVNENVVKVTFPALPDGAFYAIAMEEGAFVDYAGLPSMGFETVFSYDAESGKAAPSLPFYGRVPAVAMNIEVPNVSVVTDWTKYITLKHNVYGSGAVSNNISVIREFVLDGKKYTEESVLSGAPYYGVSGMNFLVRLAEEPGRGDILSIVIPEKTFYDVYGNYNAAITIGPFLYSFGYTVNDIAGSYTFSSTSGYASYGYGPYENVLTIAASDDEKEGNVMFTGQLSDIDVKFYADFDMDLGTITLPKYPVVGICVDVAYDASGNPVMDGSEYVVTEYYAALALSNGSSLYSNLLGFDVPAAHTLDFWYAGQAFIGILELDKTSGNPVAFYDLLNITGISYPAVVAQTAPSSARGLKPFSPAICSPTEF